MRICLSLSLHAGWLDAIRFFLTHLSMVCEVNSTSARACRPRWIYSLWHGAACHALQQRQWRIAQVLLTALHERDSPLGHEASHSECVELLLVMLAQLGDEDSQDTRDGECRHAGAARGRPGQPGHAGGRSATRRVLAGDEDSQDTRGGEVCKVHPIPGEGGQAADAERDSPEHDAAASSCWCLLVRRWCSLGSLKEGGSASSRLCEDDGASVTPPSTQPDSGSAERLDEASSPERSRLQLQFHASVDAGNRSPNREAAAVAPRRPPAAHGAAAPMCSATSTVNSLGARTASVLATDLALAVLPHSIIDRSGCPYLRPSIYSPP